MHASAAPGGTRDLNLFRRLTGVTIVATLALIVIGGIVRVSDSGLGCGPAGSGTSGWPLCGGRILPFLQTNALIEFSHRAVAGLVAALILALVWIAVRRLGERRWIVWGSVGAGVLVLAQAGLGGLTVEHNLEAALVAAHLALAMLLLSMLIALWRATREDLSAPRPEVARGLRALAAVAAVLVLATIVAGGYVAGTEGEGTASEPALGAHLACGKEFPTCVGKFMPFGESSLIDAQLTHRALMYLAAIAVIATAAMAVRRGVRPRPFTVAVVMLLAQILLGALNVWLGEQAGLIVAHLTLGSLLWATMVYATALLVPVPVAGGAPVRSVIAEGDAASAGA
jgi:heme A synthase